MAAGKRDYYDVLDVDRDASDAAVKKAFRALARKFHPDRNSGDKGAEERFKELNEAYTILSDPHKRAAYDRFGHAAFAPPGSGVGPVAGFSGSMGDVLETFLGDILGRRRQRQSGRDLRYTLEVTFAEAAFGAQKTIRFPTRAPCSTCQGTGAGGGCKRCEGAGMVRVEREFTVTLPPGTDDGSVRRVAREGEPGRRGGAPGDLHVLVRVLPHELFTRRGHDVVTELPVSFPQAALGAQVDVPTLDGKVKMKVPAGTQGGKVFRLRGKGIPRGPGKDRGDQHVRIVVETPAHLTARQRELYEQLAREAGEPVSTPKKKRFLEKVRELFDV